MLIVGLTGGIGCGKSTVSHQLQTKHNITVIDADLIARQVVYPDKPAYNKIITSFKDVPDLVNADRSLNRAALGQVVFGNRERLNLLNSIVHPAVKYEIVWQILKAYVKCKSMVVLDVPLLYESKLHLLCGLVVTISCDEEIQIERLTSRNPELSTEDILKRINSQMSNIERNYRSDVILENNKSLAMLNSGIDSLVQEIKPNCLWTLVDLFPPIGFVSALFTFTVRRITEGYKGTKPKSN
ncbi:Dephospho-CoA kinase CAB5 [Spathaspora sp. JA1]|nr:Dephospho-CoA kinase CAB5 [Spathaspora sp. JA1]